MTGTFSGPGRVEQLGKAWLVAGCPTARQTRSLDPAMVDAHADVGHVVCCSGDFTATRAGCLSAGMEASSVTFWVAKAHCEARGWRLCRKEELEHATASGSCGPECGYDTEYVWADLNDECTTCPAGKFSEAKATICQDCAAEEGYACRPGSTSPKGKVCSSHYYCPGGAMGMQTWAYARARGITGYTKTEL